MNRQPSFSSSASPAVGTARLADDREAAVRRIVYRRHRAFRIYTAALVGANALVVAFWLVLAAAARLDMVKVYVWPNQPPLPTGFFWPIVPIAICAVLWVLSWRRAYPRNGYPHDEIEREMARGRTDGMSDRPRRTDAPRPASISSVSRANTRTLTAPTAPGSTAPASTAAAQRRGFAVHLLVYMVINSLLVAAWWRGGGGFFWPVFLMIFWGAGVLVNAYLAFRPTSSGRSE
jgi:hypothetical protein